MKYKTGIYFALITAVISGFAIFLNSFAVKKLPDPYFFTFAKNLLVALVLTGGIAGFRLRRSLFFDSKAKRFGGEACPEYCRGMGSRQARTITIKQWLQLIVIGLIGGSLPFLLFFKGLSIGSASSAAFIHKTLFIWVAVLAVVFLKEKLGRWQILALIVLVAGNYLLAMPVGWKFGRGGLLVLAATLLWAVENIIAKKVLQNLPSQTVAWGRMFFGAIFILIFIVATGRLGQIVTLDKLQWGWIILSSAILFGYVGFWYSALKSAPATLVTSILVLGSPITTMLTAIFVKHSITLGQILASLIIILGIAIFIRTFKIIKRTRYSFKF